MKLKRDNRLAITYARFNRFARDRDRSMKIINVTLIITLLSIDTLLKTDYVHLYILIHTNVQWFTKVVDTFYEYTVRFIKNILRLINVPRHHYRDYIREI